MTLLDQRRALLDDARTAAGEALAAHAAAEPALARARRVAIYLAMPTEPPTQPLIEGFWARGAAVIVPVVEADHLLAWVELEPGVEVRRGALGIPEPTGPRLPADALATCDLVVVPALAADHAGHRLGRGAGYYDRALGAAKAPVCAVVHLHELLPEVPHEPHDHPVDLVLTPGGLFRVPG